MKKKYIKPSQEVIELLGKSTLLAGSTREFTPNDTEQTDGWAD